ncbi:hypothetical protein [Methanobacterium aggregans]|uniref:hypothetical protein n=1 Tax=Methanobacterium aggregans TaxID=1615586 RepID=UPI001AE7F172|nr:hypothetical protein [Methanobacterium aggregans]MBP2046049.1 hypothetical protein [Methanobacterium aggregans]
MKMLDLKKILVTVLMALIMILGVFPSFAVSSPVSTQTVTIRVPETNAISTGYGTSGASQIQAQDVSPDNTETAIGNLYVQSYSNSNTQLWVRASGNFVGAKTSNSLELSNLKFAVPGAGNEKTNFSSGYVKAGDQSPKNADGDHKLSLNLYMSVPYGTSPDTYTATVYLTSVLDATAPA